MRKFATKRIEGQDYLIVYIPINVKMPETITIDAKEFERNNVTHLTKREREVLRGIVAFKANKEIAAQLNLSERCIKFHVSSLLTKFECTGRAGLIQIFSPGSHESTSIQ